ncbi:MAG: DUF192 domain-containing protein [Henriciella sp.]
MQNLFRTIFIFVCVSSSMFAAADPMRVETVKIITAEAEHRFLVEVADDPEELGYGLMHREHLDDDKGMLFDFGRLYTPRMYMKNTLISLDMLFIDPDGTIQMIARNTVPGSLRQISPPTPILAVLEVNAGLTAALDIQAGDRVSHALFSTEVSAASE